MDAKNLYDGIGSLLAVSASRELPKPVTTTEENSVTVTENGNVPKEENGVIPETEQALNGKVDEEEENDLTSLTEKPADE